MPPSITVDPRAGSKSLIAPLRRLGLKVEQERMEFGDVAWVGNGPDGPTTIGLEHKTIGDVLSCIHTGRFAGRQLPGLKDCYQVPMLMVQGVWGADGQGRLTINKRPVSWRGRNGYEREWLYREVAHWLWSVHFQGGVEVLFTPSLHQSVWMIRTLFTWWTAKEWDEHQTLHTLDNTLQRAMQYARPSFARRVAACLPGVGWERSAAAARHFGSIEAMAKAGEAEWAAVPGIGAVTAKKVRSAIRGKWS